MRANALVTEPLLQKHMCDSLYKWQDKYRRDHIPWVLHDGPPYANGELHVGHALNKVLKDIVNRYKLLRGFRVHYVPGWDTHGLPIELKALEALMKKNKKKSQSEVTGKKELEGIEIRELCKAYVEKFINLQKIDFQRWGIMADWENYYATYHKEYEYNQIRVFKKLFEKGMIFRALKPVHWSPSSNTALAEAELEYKDDHESLAVFVGYKLDSNSSARLSELANLKDFGGSVQAVIWTTTPWSLPASLAIAYGPTMKYALVKTEAFVENARDSNIFLVAKSEISSLVGDHSYEVLHEFDGSMLSDLTAIHPFIDRRIAFLESEFVVEGSGTGLVHSAPAHGREDFIVSKRNNIAIINPVNVDATYNHLAGEDLAGKSVSLCRLSIGTHFLISN
jgi:isoleucyl-tRNA synthetase